MTNMMPERIANMIRKLTCERCGNCVACIRIMDAIKAIWDVKQTARNIPDYRIGIGGGA